jgi:hypothetical protein
MIFDKMPPVFMKTVISTEGEEEAVIFIQLAFGVGQARPPARCSPAPLGRRWKGDFRLRAHGGASRRRFRRRGFALRAPLFGQSFRARSRGAVGAVFVFEILIRAPGLAGHSVRRGRSAACFRLACGGRLRSEAFALGQFTAAAID